MIWPGALLLAGCYEFESVDQPDVAEPNGSFQVFIAGYLDEEVGEGANTPALGILLPEGWSVADGITYRGVRSWSISGGTGYSGIGNGALMYSRGGSAQMEYESPAPDGYYWWVGRGQHIDVFEDTFGRSAGTVRIHTDGQTGTFFIDYMLGHHAWPDLPGGDNLRDYWEMGVWDHYDEDWWTDWWNEVWDYTWDQDIVDFHIHRRSNDHPISIGAPMTVTVTNTKDRGEGSLRRAMAEVSSGGEIVFDLSYPATIVLASALEVDRNLTVTGPASGRLTISGNDAVRVLRINGNLAVHLSNLILSHGNAGEENGGGILVQNPGADEDPCDVPGPHLDSGTLTFTNCVVSGNHAREGGGIYFDDSSPSVVGGCITGNTASAAGGGIFCGVGSEPGLVNAILWDNLPSGICLEPTEDSWFSPCSTSITIAHCDVEGGEAGIVTNGNKVYWLDGNIDADPHFVDVSGGDFRLQEGSPCIEAGTAFLSYDGEILVDLPDGAYDGRAPDMGGFLRVIDVTTAATERDQVVVPSACSLDQNYPNPFNSTTVIPFALPTRAYVELALYNPTGQKVAMLASGAREAGTYTANWDGTDDRGHELAAGVYVYQLRAGGLEVKRRKLVLLR